LNLLEDKVKSMETKVEDAAASTDIQLKLMAASTDKQLKLMDENKELAGKLVISAKDQISLLDKMLAKKETEILGIQGLLSCRGIFEFFLNGCCEELKISGDYPKNEHCKFTTVLKILIRPRLKIPENSLWVRDFLKWKTECKVKDPVKFYAKLCNGIHGAPWFGPSVRIFRDKLLGSEYCMMLKMMGRLGVEPDDVSANKTLPNPDDVTDANALAEETDTDKK
jgi:hypothetical protein